jgi:hypothetical protein
MRPFKPSRYIFPNVPGRVEPATLPLECDVPANSTFGVGGSRFIMQPGETRLFKGHVMYSLCGLQGLCETSGLREAVSFDFDPKWYHPADRIIEVHVTLDKKAAPARVQPALHILAADSPPIKPCLRTDDMPHSAPTPYRREWRTILPLMWADGSNSDKPEPDLREAFAAVHPKMTFRGQQLVLEPAGLLPEIQVTLLQVSNVCLWQGCVPAGIFVRDDEHNYTPPELDLDTMNVAQRLQMRFVSVGRGTRVKAYVRGLYVVGDGF